MICGGKMKKTAIAAMILMLAVVCSGKDRIGPSWLLTIPTADIIQKDRMNIGLLHLDLGITPNLEAGLHGIKYSFPQQDGSELGFGVSLLTGLYPYAVLTQDYKFGRLTLGVSAFPYFVFAGLEQVVAENMWLMAEIHNGVSVGVRTKIGPDWFFDLGGGVSTYAYRNLFFVDYGAPANYSFSFPTNFTGFLVVSVCYTFDISQVTLPQTGGKAKAKASEKTITPEPAKR